MTIIAAAAAAIAAVVVVVAGESVLCAGGVGREAIRGAWFDFGTRPGYAAAAGRQQKQGQAGGRGSAVVNSQSHACWAVCP